MAHEIREIKGTLTLRVLQYVSSPGNRKYSEAAVQNLPFSSVAVPGVIAGTYHAYTRRDGQAELARVARSSTNITCMNGH